MKILPPIVKKKLREIGVSTAYLFGSQATENAGPMSDFDIAVLLDEEVKSKRYFDIKLKLMAEFGDFYKAKSVDLIILNEAPVLLAMNVLSFGKIIFCADNEYRIAFENYATSRYLDRLPYEKRAMQYLIKRYS